MNVDSDERTRGNRGVEKKKVMGARKPYNIEDTSLVYSHVVPLEKGGVWGSLRVAKKYSENASKCIKGLLVPPGSASDYFFFINRLLEN